MKVSQCEAKLGELVRKHGARIKSLERKLEEERQFVHDRLEAIALAKLWARRDGRGTRVCQVVFAVDEAMLQSLWSPSDLDRLMYFVTARLSHELMEFRMNKFDECSLIGDETEI